MKMSGEITELAKALSLAQSEFQVAEKNRENPFFKNKYSDFTGVVSAVRAPLSKNGLSFVQATSIENDKLILNTTLLHSSGQWISSQYPVRPEKDDPQSFGSAITYARRYGLTSLLGVATGDEDDDDGNTASGILISEIDSKIQKMKEYFARVGVSTSQILSHLGVSSLNQVSESDLLRLADIAKKIKSGEPASTFFGGKS